MAETKEGLLDVVAVRGRLWLIGEVDLSNVDVLEEALRTGASDEMTTIVDASALEFIDGQGLRALILAGKERADVGTELVLLDPTDQVRRVLEVTRAASARGMRIDTNGQHRGLARRRVRHLGRVGAVKHLLASEANSSVLRRARRSG